MSDVVVTVPKSFGLETWIAEGDPAGAPWSGQEWHWYTGGSVPRIEAGERVYVTYNGVLRGYAPLVRIEKGDRPGRFALVRRGDAVALTIPDHISGIRGWRYRWWETEIERPFPAWANPLARPGGVHGAVFDHLGLLRRLSNELPKWSYLYANEAQLHDGVAQVLDRMQVGYQREVVSGADRFDFLCEGSVAIEAKVRGSFPPALRQVARYCRSGSVLAVLLVTTKLWGAMPVIVGAHDDASSDGELVFSGVPVRMVRLQERAF